MAEITVVVDPRVYRLSAVKKAAYRLGDRCFLRIDALSDGTIQVRLTPRSGSAPTESIEGDFWNELLDQDLRESIAEQTERIRNVLLAQAFSGLSLTGTVADTADYRDDPLAIGQSQVVKP